MHQLPFEVLVLRPSSVFLAFLKVQLPKNSKLDLRLLNTDCSAFIIPRHNSEEATLQEVEHNFVGMFRQEISRWLGKEAYNEIQNNFLDFLCCFRMEFHSHIIYSDHNVEANTQLLVIKPRTKLLEWFKVRLEDYGAFNYIVDQVKLSHLEENASVIIKKFSDIQEIKPFLESHYASIAEQAFSRFLKPYTNGPDINSISAFHQYFFVEVHTQLTNLH